MFWVPSRIRAGWVSEQNFEHKKWFLRALPAGRSHFTSRICTEIINFRGKFFNDDKTCPCLPLWWQLCTVYPGFLAVGGNTPLSKHVLDTSCKYLWYGCGNRNIDVRLEYILKLPLAVVWGLTEENRETFWAMSSSVRNRVRKSLSKSVKGNACKFRFTVTYEYVDLKCYNRW